MESQYQYLKQDTQRGMPVWAFTQPLLRAAAIEELESAMVAAECWRATVDFANVESLVSGSLYPLDEPLGPLLRLHRKAKERGGGLVLCNLRPAVAEVFRITRLDQALEVASAPTAAGGPARCVLITGCSTGIGYACALDLAARGWRVFAGVRRLEDGQRLCAAAEGDLLPVILDVTDSHSIQALTGELDAAVGDAGLSGLVNNAGILVPGPLELLSTDDFRRQIEVNLLGTHAVTRALLPLLRRGKGRIVLVGSISGRVVPPHYGAYAASKHALEAIADAWRIELRSWGLRVAIVEPDNVATPIWNKLDASVSGLARAELKDHDGLYTSQLQAVRRSGLKMGRTGMPAARVVAAIRHALTARRPRARYPIGLRTRLAIWGAANLPTSWMDYFLSRAVE